MKPLQQIWNELPMKSDKGDIHSYLPVYESILAPYRETAKNVLEVGLFNGASLMLWEKYFTSAKIHGIDCDEQPHGGMADLRPLMDNYNISIGNAESIDDIKKFYGGIKFDVIVEDAGHDVTQQLKIFEVLHPYLAKGGVYVIEDIQDLERYGHLFLEVRELYKRDVEIVDRRNIKNRYDDCLIIIR